MISLVIYGIIAIALASAAGYAFISFTNTSRVTTQSEENRARMETAVAALRASMLALNGDGTLFVPAPNTAGAYSQLPLSLGVLNSSPWGVPYEYCPLSLNTNNSLASATANVVYPSPSTGSYQVSTYSGPMSQNQAYVVNSPTQLNSTLVQAQTGYAAFIVSSQGPGQAIPPCSAITYTAPSAGGYGGITVSGGVVRGVTAGFVYTQRVVAATDRMEIFVGSASTGNGTGQDANNLTTLDNALLIWQSLSPRLGEIYLTAAAGGQSYATSRTLDAEGVAPSYVRRYAQGENPSLVIATAPGSASTASIAFNAGLRLTQATTFDNINVNFATASASNAYKPVTFRDATVTGSGGILNVYNAQLTVSDTNITNLQLGGANSTIGFYNYLSGGTSSFTAVQVAGPNLKVSFDAYSSTSYTFDNTGSSGNNMPALSLQSGAANFSSNVTTTIKANAPGIILSASQLNIVGPMTIGASNNNSYGGYKGGAIQDLDGSSVVIAYNANGKTYAGNLYGSAGVDNAVFARGSSLAVNGSLQAYNVSYGNIGAEASTITGASTGRLIVSNNNTPCLQMPSLRIMGSQPFLPAPQNTTFAWPGALPTYSIFSSQNNNYLNSPTFPAVQNGLPPLLLFSYSAAYTDSRYDSVSVASNIVQTKGTDPYVTITPQQAQQVQAGGNITAYVDPLTFEAGVRQVVSDEFVASSMSMGFDGQCGTSN